MAALLEISLPRSLGAIAWSILGLPCHPNHIQCGSTFLHAFIITSGRPSISSRVNQGPLYTMHHEVGPRKMVLFHGPISWSDFSVQLLWSNILTNQCIKSSGLSLGVNQMWTKRNDHAPENWMCWFFNFNIRPKGGNFEEWNQVWSFFCLLVSSSSLPPQKKTLPLL